MSTKDKKGKLIYCVGIFLSYNQECAHMRKPLQLLPIAMSLKKLSKKKKKEVHSSPVVKCKSFISVLLLSLATTLTFDTNVEINIYLRQR